MRVGDAMGAVSGSGTSVGNVPEHKQPSSHTPWGHLILRGRFLRGTTLQYSTIQCCTHSRASGSLAITRTVPVKRQYAYSDELLVGRAVGQASRINRHPIIVHGHGNLQSEPSDVRS